MQLRFTILTWVTLLPLAILPSLQMATPVLGAALGFVVFKLDDAAVEVQNPFGFDSSDLGICIHNDALQVQTREMLRSYLKTRDGETLPE